MNQIIPPNLASREFKANPYPFYARLRAEAPVYRTRVAYLKEAWLVTRYDDVLAVLKDERFTKELDRFKATMPWIPGIIKPLMRSMVNLDPPDHSRVRALVHKAFTPRLVEQLRERIQRVCDDLLNAAESNGSMDLVRAYALPLPLTIIAELLGVPPPDRRKFRALSRVSTSISTTAEMMRALPKMWLLMRYLRKLVKQHRAHPQDDLVTALVQAEEGGDTLNEDELLAMVFLLLVAGHETTVNLIASGTLALLKHPQQLDRLRQNPALISSAIEELLRYTSPVDIATLRFAREKVTIGATTIPRGAVVLAVLGSANHDETQFRQPDTLDIGRAPNRHLAFGQGAHFCLGAPLARLEGEIALPTLFRRFPRLRLAGVPESLRWQKGLFFRGLEQLPLAF